MRINAALQQHAPSPVAVPHPQCETLLQQHHQLGIAQRWVHNGSTDVDVATKKHRPQLDMVLCPPHISGASRPYGAQLGSFGGT